MSQNELVPVPVFIKEIDTARRIVSSVAREFLNTDASHDVCGMPRRIVSADIEADVTPGTEAEYGYKPVFNILGLTAIECGCPVKLTKETETEDALSKLVELAPGTWNIVTALFHVEYPRFNLSKPTIRSVRE